jgi:hypothetical protein
MRRTVLTFALVAAAAAAQELASPDSAKLYAAKLAKPFFKNAAWTEDYEKALRLAREKNKPIFAYFTRTVDPEEGSEQVENGVFATKEFAAFAKDYVMLLNVATGVRGHDYDTLFARYQIESHPFVAFLDGDGGVLAAHRCAPTVAAFHESGAPAREHFAVRAKALAGDRDARLHLLLRRGERGQVTSLRFRRELAALGELAEEERARACAVLADLLFDEADLYGRARWFAEMEREGFVPEDPQVRLEFYITAMRWAQFREDLPEARRLFEVLRKLVAGMKGAEQLIDTVEQGLARLEKDLAAEAPPPSGDGGK